MMEFPKLFASFGFLFLTLLAGQNIGGVRAFQANKLFVFGDSYADTGNSDYTAPSWNQPYGMTYPRNPGGRYSDGRLLTDYIAEYYGLRTPTAYRFINPAIPKMLQYGVNFAYGGTGVFDTMSSNPNMTVQIQYLKEYLDASVVNLTDLETSLSLLSVNGNDYIAYLRNNGTIEELPIFIAGVVQQIAKDMKSLHELGARKIAVTAMAPSGCVPRLAPSPTQCNETLNLLVSLHNILLETAVLGLNIESGDSSYVILDLYSAFHTVFDSGKFATPYQGCCVGVSKEHFCGEVDDQGQPMYGVCSDPESAFYWDGGHPSQAGWNATYEQALKQALEEIN